MLAAGTLIARARDRRAVDAKERGKRGDKILCSLLLLFLSTLLFEGPLRWLLATAGIPEALYLRDAIPIVSITWIFSRSVAAGAIDPVIAVPSALLAVHGLIGLISGLALFQVAFGFKIFMNVVYGITISPLLLDRWNGVRRTAPILFGIAFLGVLLNFILGQMPWEGLEYTTAFGVRSTTLQWWIPGGISRLPGFSRGSFNAAMMLGITGVLTIAMTRQIGLKLLVTALGIGAIMGTTSKGMLLAFPIAAAWLCWKTKSPQAASGRVLLYLLSGFTLLLPLVMVLFELGQSISSSDLPPVIASVVDRFSWMWPNAFDLLEHGAGWIFGGGLGAIGTPQLFGNDPHHLNAGDNLSVFLIVNFGLAGVAYYLSAPLLLKRAAAVLDPEVTLALTGLLITMYAYGMSINMVEETFFALSWGACLGVLLRCLGARPGVKP